MVHLDAHQVSRKHLPHRLGMLSKAVWDHRTPGLIGVSTKNRTVLPREIQGCEQISQWLIQHQLVSLPLRVVVGQVQLDVLQVPTVLFDHSGSPSTGNPWNTRAAWCLGDFSRSSFDRNCQVGPPAVVSWESRSSEVNTNLLQDRVGEHPNKANSAHFCGSNPGEEGFDMF